MTDKPLAEFFSANIAPAFEAMGWASPEVNALRGAFYMGANFALQSITTEEEHDAAVAEIDEFHTSTEARTQEH